VDLYRSTGSVLVSFGPSHNVPLLAEGLIGTLAGAFARGMITALALRPESTRSAVRAVLGRWMVLLLMVVCAGGVLFLGNLGLDALLREYNVDLSDIGQISLSAETLLHSIALRTISIFIPDPGAPFSQWITYLRLEMSRVSASLIYAGGFSYYRVRTIQEAPEPFILGGVGLLLLTGGDALMRLCLASVLCAPAGSGLQPVLGALKLAGRRLALVMAHVWVVRLAIFAVNTIFVVFPLVPAQSLLTPLMINTTGNAWPYIFASALVSISLALVSMVFVAFAVIYDARLYEWLRGGAGGDVRLLREV
jgi:hypothetical protein